MSKQRVTIALAAVVCALGITAGVQASVPDGAGVIHGCYAKSAAPGSQPGALRVIDTALGQSCQINENSVNWSQTGPPGPQGPQGPQGVQGARGPTGPKGDPGANAYFAGTGLSLTGGNTFSVQSTYQLPQGCSSGQSPYLQNVFPTHPWGCFNAANANESCTSGKFQNGVDAGGDITCAAPPAGPKGPDVWVARNMADQDTPEGTPVTVATLSLPAGSYLLTGEATANGDTNGDDITTGCWFDVDHGPDADSPFDVRIDTLFLNDVVTLGASTDVNFVCEGINPHTHVGGVVMTAMLVGTIH